MTHIFLISSLYHLECAGFCLQVCLFMISKWLPQLQTPHPYRTALSERGKNTFPTSAPIAFSICLIGPGTSHTPGETRHCQGQWNHFEWLGLKPSTSGGHGGMLLRSP